MAGHSGKHGGDWLTWSRGAYRTRLQRRGSRDEAASAMVGRGEEVAAKPAAFDVLTQDRGIQGPRRGLRRLLR